MPYIITDEERKAFMSLSNDEEREAFIENFWQRRNPNPDDPDNSYRDEHYRRIQYANDHLCGRQTGLEDGPRTNLYHVGQARQYRFSSLRRHV